MRNFVIFAENVEMNIGLFGYGKMGKTIETLALTRGHHITAKVNSSHPKEEFDYSDTDVIIEFSRPELAAENIRFAADKNIPIIVGTTGWYDELETLSAYIQEKEGALLHATNFSLGVNAFFAVNRYLAKIMNTLPEYTASLRETHHTEKLDSPSGTGISLADQIIAAHDHYEKWEETHTPSEGTLPIEALRLPNVPGTHEIIYQSDIDTIEIKHTAHNRNGFALGSIIAAEWLKGKKGVFTMQDILTF